MTRSAKIVWFIGLAIFIGWLTHRAFGQTFQRSLPFLAKQISVTNSNPPPMATLAYWWVSADLPLGNVSNWVDRIQGAVFTNFTAGATQPTNTTNGVYFDGVSNQRLTNNVLVMPASYRALVFILQPLRVDGSYDHLIGMGGQYGFYLNGSKLNWYGTPKMPVNTNSISDWILDDVNWYTNGIAGAINVGAMSGSMYILGYTAGNGNLKANILEIQYYTNSLSTNAAWLAQNHQYATNTYGFTP